MKTSAILRRSVSTFTQLIALALWVTVTHAQVGRTPGTFAVSQTGAATYTIPIFAPRGPAGLQPNVALTYNSQAGNGYLGVGWSLSGLSAISRCNLTYAQDGAPATVMLAVSDGYCLDGERLRLTGGTYGTAGSTYETEIANFSRVTANGTAGNGPAYFTVQSHDGRTYEYGNGGNSQVLANGTAVTWWLDKVTDRAGNTMTVAYCTATPNCPNASDLQGMTLPATISWTPSSHGASTYNYTMQFSYEAISLPPTIGYVAGSAFLNYYLLNNIQIQYQGTTVKNYKLAYTASTTTQRQTLTSLTECADAAGSDCISPTSVTYQSGQQGVGSATTISSNGDQLNAHGVHTPYDFNGDGINDLAWYDWTTATWWVAFGSTTGYGAPINTGLTVLYARFGNIDGSGTDSFFFPNNGEWYYAKWNGSSFVSTSTGVAINGSGGNQTFALADVNGDGLPDLITIGTDTYLYVQQNTSSNGVVSFAQTPTKTTLSVNGYIDADLNDSRKLDFSGSGQQDLLFYTSGSVYVLHYTGTTFTQTYIASWNGLQSPYVSMADFNDDGCTDVLQQTTLVVSACNGNPKQTITLPGTAVAGVDWDNDGREDILVENGSTLGVYKSTGAGFSSTELSTSIPYDSSYSYAAAPNATGDGQDGLIAQSSNSPSFFQYYLHSGSGQPPDLVTSIVDGYGNSASPTYTSLARGSYTEIDGGDLPATYPYRNYIGPLYVVNNVTYSDPSNPPSGTYQQSLVYHDAWMNLQGRGLTPFYETRTLDSRDGTTQVQYYEQTFPSTGLFGGSDRFESNGSTYISHTTTSSTYTTLQSTQYQEIYFPYNNQIVAETYEVNSQSPDYGDVITSSTTNYSYDNYGNTTSIVKAVFDEDPNSPYRGDSWTTTTTNTPDPNTSTWCLNLLTETQVAYTATIGASVTRTKTLTPDTTNCRYTQIVTEPSSSTYKVTEALGYDSFGNLSSDSITGIGMTARTTSTTWSNSTYTTGQFPLSVQDPSGATTQFTYNYSLGLKASAEDANQSTTSWIYTAFGQIQTQHNPDGTYEDCAYRDAASEGLPFHGLWVNCDLYASNGSVITAGYQMSDAEDRSYMTASQSLDSGYNRTDTRYDNFNRLSSKSAPCTLGSWTSSCPDLTTTSYDVLNRPTQVQRPISSSDSNLQTTTYSYSGRTETITDPSNFSSTVINDVNSWLRQTKDAYGYTVTLSYDSAGSKTAVTDSESNTLWTGAYGYGLSAFLTSETDMDRGAWSYTIDALGERTGWTDAKHQSFGESFDALSRPLSRSEPDLFTQWTWGSTPASHNVGKLASVCTGTGTSPTNCTSAPGYSESDTYDSLARPYQRTITLPSAGVFTYTSQYSSTTGLLSSLTYPLSTNNCQVVVNYGYSYGVLTSLTDGSNQTNCGSTGTVYWKATDENDNGQIDEVTLGNGIVININFDHVTHWPGSIQAGVGGGSGVENLSFLYDEMGNVIQRQDNNRSLTENIHYDNDYRLSYTDLGSAQNLSINYDLNGNITSRSDVAADAGWTYDPTRKHAVTEAGSSAYAYSYDADGNMITRQGQTISWSSYNYPTSISAGSGSTAESVSLSYGPDRQRWHQSYTGNGATESTYYVGNDLEVVTSGAVTNYRHYIYAGSQPVAVYSRSSSGTTAVNYVLSDHQQSVAALTNSSGATVVSESFTPYGSRRNPSTWSGAASNSDLTTAASITRQAYTFQTQLGLWMGMNHMKGRVEDSTTGRFMSPDPSVQDASNAQDYNSYSYTVNNPLTYSDPTGFTPCFSSVTSTGYSYSAAADSSWAPWPTPWLDGTGDTGEELLAAGDISNPAAFNGLEQVIVTGTRYTGCDSGAPPDDQQTPGSLGPGGGGGGGASSAPAQQQPAQPKTTPPPCPANSVCVTGQKPPAAASAPWYVWLLNLLRYYSGEIGPTPPPPSSGSPPTIGQPYVPPPPPPPPVPKPPPPNPRFNMPPERIPFRLPEFFLP